MNLIVRHLVRSTSTPLTFTDNEQVPRGSATPPTSRDTSDADDEHKEELQDEVKEEAEENKENMEPHDRMQTASLHPILRGTNPRVLHGRYTGRKHVMMPQPHCGQNRRKRDGRGCLYS